MSPGRATRHRPGATASHGHQGHAHGVRMDDLLESMEEDPQYVELVTHHQRKFRISPEDMLSFVRQLGQLCMSMLVASGGGAPEAMASKLQRLQRDLKIVKEESKAKLVQCNLNALKQLDVVKGGTGGWDDKVIFYGCNQIRGEEPMQYLNEDEKEMVFMVVKDKLRQVLDGTAPDSFMGKIKTSLGMADADKLVKKGPRSIAPVHEEEEEDDFEHDAVVKARTEAKRSQDAATVARREVEEIKKRITQLQQQLEDRGVELAEAQQLLAQGERYREQLLLAMDRLKGQELQPEEASFVMSELSKSTEGFQVVFDDLPQDCTFLELAQWHDGIGAVSPVAIELHQDTRRRRKSAVCRYAEEPQAEAAVRQLQTSAASKGGRWASVRARLLPSKQKASQDNAEANRATGDSWRSKSKLNTTGSWSQDLRKAQVSPQPQVPSESSKSKATAKLEEARMQLQAELGKKAKAIEDMTKENKKLKVCLEELQAKLRQVMEKSKERGIGEELSEIAHDVGLKRVLSCPSRFDILYQDAFKRIERLEELRAKIREERQRTVIGAAVSVDPSEPSVLSLVERSPLVILQQLVSTGPAGWSLACSHSPKRGRAHPPPLEQESTLVSHAGHLSPKSSKSSASLKLPRLNGPSSPTSPVARALPLLGESASAPNLRAMATPIHPFSDAQAGRGVHWKQTDSRRALL